MPERRKAYDLQSYVENGGFNFHAAAHHLASVAIEYGKRSSVERVWPYKLVLLEDGRVVDSEGVAKDVSQQYSFNDELDRLESSAGIRMREALISEPIGTASVWISPKGGPRNYEEGRIEVGVNEVHNGQKTLISYGLAIDWEPKYCLEKAWILANYSGYDYSRISLPEDLRGSVFVINGFTPKESWALLRDLLPVDDIWQAIDDGRVEELKNKAIEAANRTTRYTVPLIERATSEYDFIRAGAYMEQQMILEGFSMLGGACGVLNSELLNQNTHIHIEVWREGICRLCERNVYVGPCSICKQCEQK